LIIDPAQHTICKLMDKQKEQIRQWRYTYGIM
jgi:hypothetical protein